MNALFTVRCPPTHPHTDTRAHPLTDTLTHTRMGFYGLIYDPQELHALGVAEGAR